MGRFQQVLADVLQEVGVAGKDRDVEMMLLHETHGSAVHGAAQVPHDGARGPKAGSHLAQARQDGIGVFRRDLPCSKHPTPPASQGHQQGATPILPRGINVQRPASIRFQRLAQNARPGLMEPFEVVEEQPAQAADLTRRQVQPVMLPEPFLDLLTLPEVDKTLHANQGHDVIANRASWKQPLSKAACSFDDLSARWPAASVPAGVDRLASLEGPMLQSPPLPVDGLLRTHGVGADGTGAGSCCHG